MLSLNIISYVFVFVLIIYEVLAGMCTVETDPDYIYKILWAEFYEYGLTFRFRAPIISKTHFYVFL